MKKLVYLSLVCITAICLILLTGCNETHTHNFGEWTVTKEASCLEDRSRTRACRCGESETEIIPAAGHKEVVVSEIPATCTESGLTEGKKCSVCGETTVNQEEIPALNHSYKYTEGTDEDGNVITFVVCQREACGHTSTSTAGLYDADNNLVASWNDLLTVYGLDIEKDYSQNNFESDQTLLHNIINNNSRLQNGRKLIISDSVNRIGNFALCSCSSITKLVIPNTVTYLGNNALSACNFEVIYTGTAEEWANVERSQYTMGSGVLIRYEDKMEFNIINFVPIIGASSGIMYGRLSVVVDEKNIYIGNTINTYLYDCICYDENFELEYTGLQNINYPLISESERQEMRDILDKIKEAETWYMLRRYENDMYINKYLVCCVDEAYYFLPIKTAENENTFLVEICNICRHEFGGYYESY